MRESKFKEGDLVAIKRGHRSCATYGLDVVVSITKNGNLKLRHNSSHQWRPSGSRANECGNSSSFHIPTLLRYEDHKAEIDAGVARTKRRDLLGEIRSRLQDCNENDFSEEALSQISALIPEKVKYNV